MKLMSWLWLPLALTACGDGDAGTGASGGSGGESTGQATGGQSSGGQGPSAGGGGTTTSAGGAPVGGSGGAGVGGGSSVPDPTMDGPFTVMTVTGTATNAVSSSTVPVKAFVPSAGPTPGPYPALVLAHGFQIAATQYDDYARRLATFGYVAINVDYAASFVGVNNVANANDLIGALNWAAADPQIAGKADVMNAGATGHSMGGKLALLAATLDSRIKASITLDPVDGAMNCSPQNCPDVSNLMPSLMIPTGFLGETTDASGGMFGMSCAPMANNYATFYAGTNAPSLSVTLNGANHMSFIEDPASCFTCGFCNMATASQMQTLGISKAYVVAFYERYLRGDTNYDAYLTGAIANQRYVATNQVTIQSK
jgi:predicted dienelactone hydrolase